MSWAFGELLKLYKWIKGLKVLKMIKTDYFSWWRAGNRDPKWPETHWEIMLIACLWWLLIARPYQQVLFIPACTVCTFYPDYNCTISNAHTFSCLPARGDSSAWIHCRPKASTYSLHLLPSCLQRLIKTHSYTLWRYRSLTPRAHTGSVIKKIKQTLCFLQSEAG